MELRPWSGECVVFTPCAMYESIKGRGKKRSRRPPEPTPKTHPFECPSFTLYRHNSAACLLQISAEGAIHYGTASNREYIVWLGGNDNWRGYCADNVFQSILVSFSKNKKKNNVELLVPCQICIEENLPGAFSNSPYPHWVFFSN